MNRLGSICYWLGRALGYIRLNLEMGYQSHWRTDWQEPREWR